MSGIVVTGASGGIGRAIATALASARPDADMLIHYCRNHDGAANTAESISANHLGRVETIQADLSIASDVDRLATNAFAQLGTIATWINNAGADVLTGDAAQWDFETKLQHLWQVDAVGTFRLARQVGQRLANQNDATKPPSMTFIGWDQASTSAGMEGDAGMMFGPIKAAVMSFANGLAQTLAPDVRVNTIAPGWIQTSWGEEADGYWDRRAKSQALMRRWGTPQDVAAAAVYLSDSDNTFLTGQTINVNGGWNRTFVRRDL
ncbi:MAG: SDR family oxidoreductase [Planctomycetota bacterium]